MDDLISRQAAIDALGDEPEVWTGKDEYAQGLNNQWHYDRNAIKAVPPAQQWIPCSERLPKINQSVLLATNGSVVFIGHRTKPELIWQVTEEDGKKHWVYDPEAYTDDIESLPKGEDCAFDSESQYEDSVLSVTSANYNPRFGGVVAWMPLPEPYGGDGE